MSHPHDLFELIRKNTLSEFVTESAALSVEITHSVLLAGITAHADFLIDQIVYVDIDHRFDVDFLRHLYRMTFPPSQQPLSANSISQEHSGFDDILRDKLTVVHPSSFNDVLAILDHFRVENLPSARKRLLILDSILSLPYLPYRSNSRHVRNGRPPLSSVFHPLKLLTSQNGMTAVCITNLYAFKPFAYLPYHRRVDRQREASHPDAFAGVMYDPLPIAMESMGNQPRLKTSSIYFYRQYPRWYHVDDGQYIRQRFLVRYSVLGEIGRISHRSDDYVNPDTSERLKKLFRMFVVTPIQSHRTSSSGTLTKEDAFEFLTEAQSSVCKGMSLAQEDTILPQPQTVEEYYQERYNSVMILKSRAKLRDLALTNQNSSSPRTIQSDPLAIGSVTDVKTREVSKTSFWAQIRCDDNSTRGESKASDFSPPFYTWEEMMTSIGGVQE